jgi:hypothetical protein
MHYDCRVFRDRSSGRPRRARRLWALECLEVRALLAATVYTVDALTDTGAGSGTAGDLQYVIDQADANPNPDGSLIQFDPTFFSTPRTITLSSTLDLTETAGPEVISGPGPDLLTISGNGDVGVFSVASGVTATLDGLTIARGSATLAAGIFNDGGTLTISDSTLVNNSAALAGGIFNDGGTLTISDSTLANNSAALAGGIYNDGGTVNISDSTLASDSANYSGGGIYNEGELTISGSTLADNSAHDGGGIDNYYGPLTISDSTVAGNSADDGGGVDLTYGPMTAVNDTFAYNSVGGAGGGIYLHGGMVTLDNTIVALNTRLSIGGTTPDDISQSGGVVSSASANNLIGTGGSGGLIGNADNQVGVAEPGLGTLGYYGGPTQTIPLLPGSPAIASGSTALAVDPTTGQTLEYDQRGIGFDRIVNGAVDIGAYQSLPAATDSVSVSWGTVGTAQLYTAADGLRLLPAGRNTDLPWYGIQQLQITLGQAQVLTAADVTVNSAIGVNYGPVTVSGSGTDYTITLAQPIDAADRVTITIVNPGVSLFNRQIDVLPGDVNDDGVVNNQDLADFREQWLDSDHQYSVFDDIIGDGVLNVEDYELIRAEIGTSLPAEGASQAGSGAQARADTGPAPSAAPIRIGLTSPPASSGHPVSQASSASKPPTIVIGPAARPRGWSLGTSSKKAVTNGTWLAGS